MTIVEKIRHLNPCPEAKEWLQDREDEQQAWDDCKNGSWMFWLIRRVNQSAPWSDERKPMVACTIELALLLWPRYREDNDTIHALQAWTKGDLSTEDAKQTYDTHLTYGFAKPYTIASVLLTAHIYFPTNTNSPKAADIVRKFFPTPPRIKGAM